MGGKEVLRESIKWNKRNDIEQTYFEVCSIVKIAIAIAREDMEQIEQ